MLSCKYWGLNLVVEAWLASKCVDGLVQWKKWFAVTRPTLKSIAPGTDNLLYTLDAILLWEIIVTDCIRLFFGMCLWKGQSSNRRCGCASLETMMCILLQATTRITRQTLSMFQTKTGRTSIIWEQEIELNWPNRLFWEVRDCTYIGLLERNRESRGWQIIKLRTLPTASEI